MSTKKRILVILIVAVLAAIVIYPMLPLEYRLFIIEGVGVVCGVRRVVAG